MPSVTSSRRSPCRLEEFAYRNELSIWMFAFAGALGLLIAFAIVSYQTFRAAIPDPVCSLRYE